ncbi:unnamed protein product [Staurois parvus]|uniref:Uncharacterized protein n=1 Tax=Staurois parvus TaxID=386267 RepID=A0ABN9ADZ3_9NEOB|nr:unnamed protein product [Staurois parvus]
MLKCPPSSSVGDDYQESNGRVAEQKQLQLKAIHRPRLKSGSRQQRWRWMQQYFGSQTQASVKSGSRQQREQTTEAHGAVWRWRQQQWKAIQHPITKWNPPTV